jgi:tRNA pseudouridine38-40 synthase
MRCLQEVRISSLDDLVVLEFTANAFLYHMVRNLVGTLVEIGLQRQSVSWARELLAGLRRADAGATAPACGLTLVAVNYAHGHEIPIASPPVWLVPHGA